MWTSGNRILDVVLLCIYALNTVDALVCYDNVVNGNETVRIGCDFSKAACATTILKRNITTIFGKLEIQKAYYHCAKRSTTCKFGPSNICTEHENTTCDTHCCDSNECNTPPNGTANMVPLVDSAHAITCYQYIGYRVEKVRCLFEKAQCLYIDLKPWNFDIRLLSAGKVEYKKNQYCATYDRCAAIRQYCDAYSSTKNSRRDYVNVKSSRWNYLTVTNISRIYPYVKNAHNDICSMKCCSTSYCNLQRKAGYLHSWRPTDPEIPKYDHKRITHSWDGYRNYKTKTATTTTTTTTSTTTSIATAKTAATKMPKARYYNNGAYSYTSGKFMYYVIGFGLSIVITVIITVLKYMGGKRPKPKTRSSRASTQLAGYNRGERV